MSMKDYEIPRFPEPFWRDMDLPIYNSLIEDISVDVAIVGAGITGITAGYLLANKGLKVAILEAGRVLNGTTGHTTAKITAQHGLIYNELLQNFGEERAKMYYQGSADAMEFINRMVNEHSIECDFATQEAILYAVSDKYAFQVEEEADAYRKLGIRGELTEEALPFNIKSMSTLVMPDQAQFHPLKYLNVLLRKFIEAGGVVYENVTATDVEEGSQPKVVLRNGKKVSCEHVIAASHYPFVDKNGFYFTRLEVKRSYIVAVTTQKEFPGGMFYGADSPTRSLRSTPLENGEQLVLVSGDGHKTGQGEDTMKHYMALEEFANDVFGIKEYKYRWSAQDMITLDKIPYIGPVTEKNSNIHIATGYRKWGMTNGTQAAILLSDTILGKENVYRDFYAPQRFDSDPDIKKFIQINADVAKHLVKGKLEYVGKEPGEVEVDEGAVVMVKGERAGAYRDHDGCLHLVDTTCTHLGCEVEWNHGDRTWDCPCHGSRYTYDGTVVEGPAVEPLKKLNLD
ncbi:FAD-dependent oxidoreductase [Robertmurraya sp.]|jgi:glycine/D-amino acid oxidase-like deaminating enzyme/nitrite reductase/ring-hydroxylating ferredoxin subunit|uniref:FAD-dependent oxidoreductase n=1 Tax=Robertmurraya sp. TaxID=2837525 RepID=UPI00370385A9